MKRTRGLWAVVAVILAGWATPATAQPAGDEWNGNEQFRDDVLTQGPVVGFGFRS